MGVRRREWLREKVGRVECKKEGCIHCKEEQGKRTRTTTTHPTYRRQREQFESHVVLSLPFRVEHPVLAEFGLGEGWDVL